MKKINIVPREAVDLSKVWIKEDINFTPWLSENLELLTDEIEDIDHLQFVEKEKKIERIDGLGNYKIDIVATTDGKTVVIENQYSKSNHDHLGKLLTYCVAIEAVIGIWIVEKAGEEHRAAIKYLNQSLPDKNFYLIELEVYLINEDENSMDIQPKFKVMESPSDYIKTKGDNIRGIEESKSDYYEFWTQLIDKAEEKSEFLAGKTPSKEQRLSKAIGGVSGVNVIPHVFDKSAGVMLSLDIQRGNYPKETNTNRFMYLKDKSVELEQQFQGLTQNGFFWINLNENTKSQSIWYFLNREEEYDNMGIKNRSYWSKLQDELIIVVNRFVEIFSAYKEDLKDIIVTEDNLEDTT